VIYSCCCTLSNWWYVPNRFFTVRGVGETVFDIIVKVQYVSSECRVSKVNKLTSDKNIESSKENAVENQ